MHRRDRPRIKLPLFFIVAGVLVLLLTFCSIERKGGRSGVATYEGESGI